RKTQTLRLRQSVRNRFHRAATPRSNSDLRLLRKTLCGNLIAELSHDIARGPDENNSHLAAEIGEGRVLRHKAPSDPCCVSACGGHYLFEALVIEVAALTVERIPIHELR